uniref:Uncharacterized protein n=1 Tax=Polytomella parva TaxID=51329 RepID=A0A7S0VJU7_9CHLO|mmetsp:Transcript_33682/g.60818  ORF Transcript_33682/g.60818 Transcript_33682/m.60818 type:complete len:250 (+) Transcript_33682:37-786(+)
MEFVSLEGLRIDGRRPKELRRLACHFDVLEAADGSAIFEMGNTKVLASVFGPHEVRNRSECDDDKVVVKCEYAMASFSTGDRRRRGKIDRRSNEISHVIKNTLEQLILVKLMPRSQIDVYIQVLQADGGMRSAAINAAVLALASAGVPMVDIVSACTAGYLDGTALLDLNVTEDNGGGPDVSVAFAPNSGKILQMQMDGRMPEAAFNEVAELAREGCVAVAGTMRTALLEHTRQKVKAQTLVLAPSSKK